MKEKIQAILGNRFVQWVFGGSFLTLLADLTDTFHTETVLAATATCDTSTVGGAIAKLFGLC